MELCNFASFSGALDAEGSASQVVGPFTKFTGVLGPNGSGKSNIFDAIAFALNLNQPSRRQRNAADYVHRPRALEASKSDEHGAQRTNPFDLGPQADQPALDPPSHCFVKLNMLKQGISDPRALEKFCV